MFSYERNRWKFEHVLKNSVGNEIWSKKENYFYILFFFKNCTSLGPNWSILLGSWKGQIEKKFQSRIHRGQFRFWRGRNDTCPTRFGSNSPKRTLMGQIGPREIGANLAFGVNLALFILQWTAIYTITLSIWLLIPFTILRGRLTRSLS